MHRVQLQSRRRVAAAVILAAVAVPGGTSAAWGMTDAGRTSPAPDASAGPRHAAVLSLAREQRAAQAAAVDLRAVPSSQSVPVANSATGSSGFDWTDAGIGAALALGMAGVGGVVLTGRRRGLAH
jgi:hypothetical protein